MIWKQPYSTSARTTAKVRGRYEKIIVLGGFLKGRRNDGWVFALSASGEMLWKYRYWPEDRKETWEEKWAPMDFSGLVAIDLNGDGSDEIVCVSTSRWLTSHSTKWREKSSRVGTLHCLTVTGELLWKAKLTAYSPSSTALRRNLLLAADLNGDGEIQIISGCHGLAVFRSDGQEIWGRPCSGSIWEVAAGDVNGDGSREVVAAAGAVEVFSVTGERLMEYVEPEGPKTLALADIDSDGIQEIIVGAEGIFVLKL